MKPSEMLSGVVKTPPKPAPKPAPMPAQEGPVEESIFNFHLLIHCLPAFSMVSSLVFVNVMSIPFYTSIGVPVEYLLLAVALSRAVDAMTDPFIAHWFETIRPEFTNDQGVRNQACLIGGITSAILLGLHLSPPPGLQSNSAILTWFGCTYIFFTMAFSFVSIPLTAALWKQYVYQGAVGEHRRTGTALFTELVLHGGLALMFFLTGLAPAVDRYAKGKTNGEYDSCYSPSGTGESCMVHPNDGSRVQYGIFNATVWDAGVSSGTSTDACQSTLDGTLITDYTTLFAPENCIAKTVSAETNACLQQYCACVGECSNLSNMVTRRVFVGAAGWLMCSVLIFAVLVVMVHLHGWKELIFPAKSRRRTASVEETDTSVTLATTSLPVEPLVPKLVNILRNKVVCSFLLPWALDTIMLMTVLGTVGYFVRSVIKPEYAEDCNSAIPVFGTVSDLWRCQNRAIASLQLTLISLSSGVFAFGWFYLSRVVGTVRAWQLGSLICLLTVLALLFSAQRNDVNKSLGLGLLFGVGVGSQFLSESVVIDVIHYYEFISGRQYQATFAMFKYLFLKLSIILMHMVPIALFYEAKFDPVPPAYVKTLLDIGPEGSLCQVFTVAIPAILCAASFYFKMNLRLVDKEQFDLTAEGIRTLYHGTPIPSPPTSAKPVTNTPAPTPVSSPIPASSKRAQRGVTPPPAPVVAAPAHPPPVVVTATDPTSGVMYPQDSFSRQERQVAQVFSYFIEAQNTIDYSACVQSRSWAIGNELLIGRIRDIGASVAFLVIALVVGIAVSADCLENNSGLFIIPLLLIIAMGYALFAMYCAAQAMMMALQLKEPRNSPSPEAMAKLVRHNEVLKMIAQADLPTREVLRQHRAALEAPPVTSAQQAAQMLSTLKANQSSKHKSSEGESKIDPRASKEVRDRLNEEAFNASVPTKEEEIIEWEQALGRAAKRALARSKSVTPKLQKLIKTLLRSSKLNPGGEPTLTRWEAEFYSHVAAQAHKKLNPAPVPIYQGPPPPRRTHSNSFNAGGLSDDDDEEADEYYNGGGEEGREGEEGDRSEEGSQYTISSFGEGSDPDGEPSPGHHQQVHGSLITPQSVALSPLGGDEGEENGSEGEFNVSSESEPENDGFTPGQSQGPSQIVSQANSLQQSPELSRQPSGGAASASRSRNGTAGTGKSRSRRSSRSSRSRSRRSSKGDTSQLDDAFDGAVGAGSFLVRDAYETLGSDDLDAESVIYSLEDSEDVTGGESEAFAGGFGYRAVTSTPPGAQTRQRFDSIALSEHNEAARAPLASFDMDVNNEHRQRFESIALSAQGQEEDEEEDFSVDVSLPTSEDEA